MHGKNMLATLSRGDCTPSRVGSGEEGIRKIGDSNGCRAGAETDVT
jgi:hypothetical protein